MAKYVRLLGKQPPQSAIKGGAMKLQWLRNQFIVVSTYLTYMEVERYAAVISCICSTAVYFQVPPQIRYISSG